MNHLLVILCLMIAAEPYTVIVKKSASRAAHEIESMMRDDEKVANLKHQTCEDLLGEMRREMDNGSHPDTIFHMALQLGVRGLMDWAEYQSHPRWRKRGRDADK